MPWTPLTDNRSGPPEVFAVALVSVYVPLRIHRSLPLGPAAIALPAIPGDASAPPMLATMFVVVPLDGSAVAPVTVHVFPDTLTCWI